MKTRLIALACAAAMLLPTAAPAQVFTATGSPISLSSAFLAPIPCGSMGFVSGAAEWCAALNAHIAAYNQIIQSMNQIASIKAQATNMLLYPQQVNGNAINQYNSLMGMLGSAPGTYYSNYSADRTAYRTLNSTVNGQTPQQQNQTLTNSELNQSDLALGAAYHITTEDNDNNAKIANIQAAAAAAKSPQQLLALNLQLSVLMMSQLSRMQQLLAQQINQDANHNADLAARTNAERQQLLQAAGYNAVNAVVGSP
jgi:hypothetical protein